MWLNCTTRKSDGIIEGDTMKLACFLTEPLRVKCKLSKYEIYIDRKAKDYLTYHHCPRTD